MASSGPRFCPRCGTARVGDMAFCPNCGLDLRELPRDEAPGAGPSVAGDNLRDPALAPSDRPPEPRSAPPDRGAPMREGTLLGRLLLPRLLFLLVLLAGAWALGWGPFGRGGDGGAIAGGPTAAATPSSPFLPAVTAQPSISLPPGVTAPPVGLTILSPADGSVVGAKNVTVIGTAPPGLRITQDISLGFDRHATADSTGPLGDRGRAHGRPERPQVPDR